MTDDPAKSELVASESHPAPVSHAQDGGDPFLAMIERAARDPQVDVEKMERLVALFDGRQERALEVEAEAAFNTAMSKVQGQMRRVVMDAENTQTHSRYATFGALDRELRPIYSAVGLALSYNTEEGAPPEHIRIVCFVTHTAEGAKRSYTRKYRVDMPADGKGAKGGDVMTKTHAAGSAFSYGQRYLLRLIFNMAVGKDDDGNAAGKDTSELIGPDEIAYLTQLMTETETAAAAFLKAMKVEAIQDLTFDGYKQALTLFARKKSAMAKGDKPKT